MAQGQDGAQVTLQSGQTGVAVGQIMNVGGLGNVAFEVSSGPGTAWSGTIVPQASTDGINWDNVPVVQESTGAVLLNGVTQPGKYDCPVAGKTLFRANSTQISQGQVSVISIGTISPGSLAIDAVIPCSKFKVRNLQAVVQAIKASPGVLSGLRILNTQGAATAWIQLFDLAATSVVLATTTPDDEISVAASTVLTVPLPSQGVAYSNAISIASTTQEYGNSGSAAGVHVFASYA